MVCVVNLEIIQSAEDRKCYKFTNNHHSFKGSFSLDINNIDVLFVGSDRNA
ncbi:MAG: hypothetical protein F6K22_29865 [Okeania sp. SIO2F4]|uniref:hypothetical protein n=1 Tax=Okeania sp. SIO2F4 TaxID=2607790 RepID=UPI00142A59EE|nr:hypothetical protein [Okeania sp. SIO2F4]MDJ0517737.1 hypothetical protein [Trichodesmium sp. MO_231.B1]NES06658.1 hypothetical protein [Okeania sp. SIO2F4]